jgi:hypothetical protein
MKTRRQFLITIRVDAEDSEPLEYFLAGKMAGSIDYIGDQLDLETISSRNHEIVDYEEITLEE